MTMAIMMMRDTFDYVFLGTTGHCQIVSLAEEIYITNSKSLIIENSYVDDDKNHNLVRRHWFLSAARGGEAVAGTHLVPVSLRLIIMIIMMMMMTLRMMMMMMVKQIANLVINSSKDQDVQYEQ